MHAEDAEGRPERWSSVPYHQSTDAAPMTRSGRRSATPTRTSSRSGDHGREQAHEADGHGGRSTASVPVRRREVIDTDPAPVEHDACEQYRPGRSFPRVEEARRGALEDAQAEEPDGEEGEVGEHVRGVGDSEEHAAVGKEVVRRILRETRRGERRGDGRGGDDREDEDRSARCGPPWIALGGCGAVMTGPGKVRHRMTMEARRAHTSRAGPV